MKIVDTSHAPRAIGPYSQAVIHAGLVYCSGQIPLDPQTMKVVEGGIEEQTRRVFANLLAVLAEAGSGPTQVIKTIVFLKDLNDFTAMNAIYEQAFGKHTPARSTIEVARLPLDVRVEIECIAAIS
ncbi:MAG TPA: RidA family protein [Rubrivivax sp.]|nr:RidA family protein [Rubrivivax sp.]